MYPYILCFCGRSLGDIYDLFKMMRLAKTLEILKAEEADVNPALLAISDVQIRLDSIFADLHITTECCKARLSTQVELKELI